jgi:hypothetical protein
MQCVLIADTVSGDEFIIHPSNTETIYTLPRHSEEIFEIVGGLNGLLTWLRTSNVFTRTLRRTFAESSSD